MSDSATAVGKRTPEHGLVERGPSRRHKSARRTQRRRPAAAARGLRERKLDFPQFALPVAGRSRRRRRPPVRPHGLPAIRATRCRAPGVGVARRSGRMTSRNSRYPLPRSRCRRRPPVRPHDFPQFALPVAAHSPRRRRPPVRPHGLPAIRATRCRALPASASAAGPAAWTSRNSRYLLPRAPRVDAARRSDCMDFPQFALPVATRSPRRRRPPVRLQSLRRRIAGIPSALGCCAATPWTR